MTGRSDLNGLSTEAVLEEIERRRKTVQRLVRNQRSACMFNPRTARRVGRHISVATGLRQLLDEGPRA